jgi:hypothetical protein
VHAALRALQPSSPAAAPSAAPSDTAPGGPAVAGFSDDPRAFLLRVMNDASAPLALRVEAAKALLLREP